MIAEYSPQDVVSPIDSPIRVLHVDDDPGVLELTERFLDLSDEKLQLLSVDDPQAALERLRSDESIECLLSDYEMPGMNGLEFLAQVRALRPNVPFILYTARDGESVVADAISAGVTDYIEKDIDRSHYLKLSLRIRREVERARAKAECKTYQAALEAAREGICLTDADGRVSYANKAYLDLYGYEREALLGKSWESVQPEDEVAFITSEVLPQIEADGGRDNESESQGVRAAESAFRESKSVTQLPAGGLAIVVTAYRRATEPED